MNNTGLQNKQIWKKFKTYGVWALVTTEIINMLYSASSEWSHVFEYIYK